MPLKNHDAEVVGVLQLIDARRAEGRSRDGRLRAEVVPLIEALAGQAAVALDNQMLIEAQRNLFRAILGCSPARSTPNRPIPAATATASPS